MSKALYFWSLMLLAACSVQYPLAPKCSAACLDSGWAVPGHCVGSADLCAIVGPCHDPLEPRRANPGEQATVRSQFGDRLTSVLDPRWAQWAIMTDRAAPGESGAAVVGVDGRVLGIVDSNHDGMSYAVLPENCKIPAQVKRFRPPNVR